MLLVTSLHVTPWSEEYSTLRPGSIALVSSFLPTNLKKKFICKGLVEFASRFWLLNQNAYVSSLKILSRAC